MKKVFAVQKALLEMPNMPGAYVHGANNPKTVFLSAGKSVLRAMAKALGLVDYKVWHNAGGVAVTGESHLQGFWSEGNGIDVSIVGFSFDNNHVLYRRTDGKRLGGNCWMSLDRLAYDWDGAVREIGRFNRELDSHEQRVR